MEKILKKLKNKEDLSFDESVNAFETIMEGKANDQQMQDFLTLLSAKGEQAREIAGWVYVLRNKSIISMRPFGFTKQMYHFL